MNEIELKAVKCLPAEMRDAILDGLRASGLDDDGCARAMSCVDGLVAPCGAAGGRPVAVVAGDVLPGGV